MRLPAEALKATQSADSEPENYRGSNDYSCVHDDSPCPVPTDTRLQNTALDRDGWGGGGLLVTTSSQARENPAPPFLNCSW